jgi:hypothetical protein
MTLGGPQSLSGYGGKQKTCCFYQGLNTSHPAHGQSLWHSYPRTNLEYIHTSYDIT